MNKFLVYGVISVLILGFVFVQAQVSGTVSGAKAQVAPAPVGGQGTKTVCTAGKDADGNEYSNNIQGCIDKFNDNPPKCPAGKTVELSHCSTAAPTPNACQLPNNNDVGIECTCTYECV